MEIPRYNFEKDPTIEHNLNVIESMLNGYFLDSEIPQSVIKRTYDLFMGIGHSTTITKASCHKMLADLERELRDEEGIISTPDQLESARKLLFQAANRAATKLGVNLEAPENFKEMSEIEIDRLIAKIVL